MLMVFVHVIRADVPLLIGRNTLENWSSNLDMVNGVLGVELNGERKMLRVMVTKSGHYGLEVENEECVKEEKWMKKRRKRHEGRRNMKLMKKELQSKRLMVREMEKCEKCRVKKEVMEKKEEEEKVE